ncbi:ribonuclease H-like domain-containing protein [Hymenobacter jeongseonensis]|uniref:ribonuclease H-like domain-containing protein n=1 Tax=Hymenobacter jeongseonensis TaxID=2791027 RepID=UPI001E342BBE|nr:ribonuclease H-like domain-containing protein [Hymenobacter jeongseonensis]
MNILRNVDLTRVFFVDIETVPGHATHAELPAAHQSLWKKFCEKRHARELADGQSHEELFANGGLYAEFGKIVCISVGKFYQRADETLEFKVKSFASDDECEVLRGFARALGEAKPYGTKLPTATTTRQHDDAKRIGHYLCAHNGREFDYGYLGRRMLICGQAIPTMLDIAGYKGWDLPHLLDTMDLWKFGDFKGTISLALLAGVFGIPSPKDDIDGSQVGHTYWTEKDLKRIVTYCEKDVITTARVFLHYLGQQALWPEVQLTHMPWPAVPLMRIAAV